MNDPRDLVADIEACPRVPAGSEERFAGYGVMGLPFGSGHLLALRRFPASSIGPGYRSVWHCDPNGRWTFFQEIEAAQDARATSERPWRKSRPRRSRSTGSGPSSSRNGHRCRPPPRLARRPELIADQPRDQRRQPAAPKSRVAQPLVPRRDGSRRRAVAGCWERPPRRTRAQRTTVRRPAADGVAHRR